LNYVGSHWIEGDPDQFEVYGWASWSRRKGILALRNPNDQAGKIILDIGKAFELPKGACRKYELKSPWQEDQGKTPFIVKSGTKHLFELRPFEVLIWDANPVR